MAKSIRIHFGAFSKSLQEQLDNQNVIYPVDTVNHWQKDADALTRLRVRGVITSAMCRSGEQKLMKTICANVQERETVDIPQSEALVPA